MNIFSRKITGALINVGFLLQLCLFYNAASAEKLHVTLNWGDKVEVLHVSETSEIRTLSFDHCYPSPNFGSLPLYHSSFPISSAGTLNCSLSNEVYAPVPAGTLTNASYIKDQPVIIAKVGLVKKNPIGQVDILPLRKNSLGQIEALQSFDIDYTIGPSPYPATGSSRSFTAHSVFNSGDWYKIALSADGMYKLDYDFLKNKLGLDLASLDIHNMGLFTRGGGMVPEENRVDRPDDVQEIALMVSDANGNGKIDNGDYL